MKISVAGTGYVGLSVALLLSQHNEVCALDIVPEKVDMLNHYDSPIVDEEIKRFLEGKRDGTMALDFHATTDPEIAYRGSEFVIVATPLIMMNKRIILIHQVSKLRFPQSVRSIQLHGL